MSALCVILRASSSLGRNVALASYFGHPGHRSASPAWTRQKSYKVAPKDEAIPYRVVQLVDEETNRLNPPARMTDILASINTKTHFVELVTTEQSIPVVKIVNKDKAAAKRRAQKERVKARGKPMEHKEIQMTWGVASGDLAHKLKKAREELAKGNRIDVVFAPKANQPHTPRPVMDERMQEVVEMMKDVAMEWQDRKIQKGVAVIRLQRLPPRSLATPPPPSSSSSEPQ